MNHRTEFRKLLLLGIGAEVLILFYSLFQSNYEWNETFRLSARYSGRFSLFFLIAVFYSVTLNWQIRRSTFREAFVFLTGIFAVLHFIHLVFLGINVFFNQIDLVPYKLLGGFLGYFLILIYPFWLKKGQPPTYFDNVYFYYLFIIMLVTLVSRLRGSFEGAKASPIHYFGLALVIVALVFHVWKILKINTKS